MFKWLKTNAQLRIDLEVAHNLIANQDKQIACLQNEVTYYEGTNADLREKLTVKTADVEWLSNDIKRRHEEFERSEYRLRAEIAVLREQLAELSEPKPRIVQGAHGVNINGKAITGSMDMFVTIPKRAAVDETTRAAMVSAPAPVSAESIAIAAAMTAAFSDNAVKDALGCNTHSSPPPACSYDTPGSYDSSSSSSCDTGEGGW